MKFLPKSPLVILCFLIAGTIGASAQQTRPRQIRRPLQNFTPRMVMRGGTDPSTHMIISLTVDDGPLVHTAQILPWDASGGIAAKGDAARQIEQALANLSLVLKASDSDDNSMVKLNVQVAKPEMAQMARNTIVQKLNSAALPAVTVTVGKLTNPDALVAMDAVAVPLGADNGGQAVKRFGVATLPGFKGTAAAILPGGGKYYVSGQAKNGALAEAAHDTLASLGETLKFLGLNKTNVVQLRAFVQPITSAEAVQAEVAKFFGSDWAPPAVYVEWSSPTNTPIEIEMIVADNKPALTNGNSVDYLTPPGLTLSKIFSRVAHVNRGKMIYFSGFYGNGATVKSEVSDIFVTLDDLLPKTATDFDHLVKATYFVMDDDGGKALNDVRPKFFNETRPPAASKAVVAGVGMDGKKVAIDLIGVTK